MSDELKNYYIVNTSTKLIEKVLARQISAFSIEWEIAPQVFMGINKPNWYHTHSEAIKHLIYLTKNEMDILANYIEKLEYMLTSIEDQEDDKS